MALTRLLVLALLHRGVQASQEVETCESAGECEEAGFAQLRTRTSLARKGGDSDEDAGQCKKNGKICTSGDKCCSGSCSEPVVDAASGAGAWFGRCVDGAALAQSDQERGVAEKGGDSDEDAGQCKNKGKICTSGDKCCSGKCSEPVVDQGSGAGAWFGRCVD
jgi:hypothetical protein